MSLGMCNMMDSGNPDTSSSSVHENSAISPPTSIETANRSTPGNNKVASRANTQASVEDVSDESNYIIPQTELAQPTGHGDLIKPRRKGHSRKNRKAKRARSTAQKKSKGLAIQKTSHQQAGGPHSVTRYSGYAQMRCLFGPGKEKALSEAGFIKVFELATKSSRPDIASFLEIQSNLWQTNRFWSPDPLRLSVPEDLPVGRSCLSLFRYLRDLREETQINVVRRRFAQLRLHLSFIHLCNEMENPKSASYKTDLNGRKAASHAIDDLMRLEAGDQNPDNRLTLQDRGHFIHNNARGRRWYLISRYIGWGALIILDNIDSTM